MLQPFCDVRLEDVDGVVLLRKREVCRHAIPKVLGTIPALRADRSCVGNLLTADEFGQIRVLDVGALLVLHVVANAAHLHRRLLVLLGLCVCACVTAVRAALKEEVSAVSEAVSERIG